MHKNNANILIINAGSSSIKFALFEIKEEPVLKLSGKIEKIGLQKGKLVVKENEVKKEIDINADDFNAAIISLIEWCKKQSWFENVKATGHRIVHGMHHTNPEIITEKFLNELNNIADYDPEHLPAEIAIIQLLKNQYPLLLQVACFDTAFHTTISLLPKHLPFQKNILMKAFSVMAFMAFLTVI